MRRIFSKLLYEIEEERNVMLVTVIADRGSAPRGAGAAMLVGERGLHLVQKFLPDLRDGHALQRDVAKFHRCLTPRDRQ